LLGIASYAIVDGDQALVYDTHVSVEHGRLIRDTLEMQGVRRITVLLSHWRLDRVGGTEAFAGCELIATARNAELLARKRSAIEPASSRCRRQSCRWCCRLEPSRSDWTWKIGRTSLELFHVNIHSNDADVTGSGIAPP
jgi:cyclase